MYEAVKKYEMYVAHNKHHEGKSASPHTNHQRTVAQTSSYKPCFHKTTAFMASVEETTDSAPSESGPSAPENEDHPEVDQPRKMMRGYLSPASWRRLWKAMVTFRLRRPAPCRLWRNKKGDVSFVSPWIIIKEKMGKGPSS